MQKGEEFIWGTCGHNRAFWVSVVVLTLPGCGWFMPWPARYLAQATGTATQEQVAQQLEPPQVVRVLDDGETVWAYRYTGVSSPMLLPITEGWCVEYRLIFDPEKILRHWRRQECGQPLDLNVASPEDLKTLPGIGVTDVSRIIAGRPYRSKGELVEREIVPQAIWDQIKDEVMANPK